MFILFLKNTSTMVHFHFCSTSSDQLKLIHLILIMDPDFESTFCQ